MPKPPDPVPAESSVAALRRALERARDDRDTALRDALEAEQQRDLSRGLALRFESELEAFRRETARALNDEFGGHAQGIRTMASTLEARLSEREPSLAQLAALIVRNADAMLETVRSLVRQVRPGALEEGGLTEGLRALVADWRLRAPALRFELLLEPEDDAAFGLGSARAEAAAYRIVREALDNAVAHSGASTIVVSVHSDGRDIAIQVSDDGRGLARQRRREGTGLLAMRELAEAAGGSVTVATGESGGVEVLARLPWRGPADTLAGA